MELVSVCKLYLVAAVILGFLALASTDNAQKIVFAILAHGLFLGAVLADDASDQTEQK